jgi:hypothetical protein
MGKRVVGLLMVASLLFIGALTAPAWAVEGGEEHGREPLPGIDEIGSDSETAQEFFPEPYEPPPFFRFMWGPLVVVAVVVSLFVLFAYLVWQPRFAQERRAKRRR